MASIATIPAFPCKKTCSFSRHGLARRSKRPTFSSGTWRRRAIGAKLKEKTALEYRKLGDSDLNISEITLGTVFQKWVLIFGIYFLFFDSIGVLNILQMTFGEQNTEKEAHEILSYAFEHGINALDTAEAVSWFAFEFHYFPQMFGFHPLCNLWCLISVAFIRSFEWILLFFNWVCPCVKISCVFILEYFAKQTFLKLKGNSSVSLEFWKTVFFFFQK